MKILVILICSGLLGFTAQAASIHEARVNSETKEVSLLVSYCFDVVPRVVELQTGSCLETYPQQCAVDLIVERETPAATAAHCQFYWLTYDASALTPAYVTFQANDGSHKRVFVDK